MKTFAGHNARVNAVKWIQNKSTSDEFTIISGSDDSDAIVWNVKDFKNPERFPLKGHKGGVTCVDGIYVDQNEKLTCVTASADSTIKIWSQIENSKEFECFQTIDLNTGICFAVSMCLLPGTNKILVAFALDDDKIHLYLDKEENQTRNFTKIEILSGHEDWVRGLDFTLDSQGDILLASASQDSFIRMWRISKDCARKRAEIQEEDDIQIEERSFMVGDAKFALSLESVLQGHENWVYGVSWNFNQTTKQLQLLSSSMDKTMIVWMSDETGVWAEKVRVGEVGGNTLGFYGGKFRKSGKSIVGHSFQGSFHIWHQNEENEKLWEPGSVIGGHYKEVKDLAWEPQFGGFLLSVSFDQTTRVHAAWKRDGKPEASFIKSDSMKIVI